MSKTKRLPSRTFQNAPTLRKPVAPAPPRPVLSRVAPGLPKPAPAAAAPVLPELKINQVLFRRLFWGLAALLLVGLPLLSSQYGITADEWYHKNYGEKVLHFFSTYGRDKGALSYGLKGGEYLYTYGPTFDVLAAGLYKFFHISDEFGTRHLLNALYGVLLLLATGLTARQLGGWRAGLLALLVVTLSPRLFGDLMNNPKDPVFAAGYMLAVYGMIRFFGELPRPRWPALACVALGAGIAIGSRVGGFLVLIYFLFFTALEAASRRDLRALFVIDRRRVLMLSGLVALTALGGYALGIAFWPYMLSSPVKNPLSALVTNTNFPIVLKTLFEGQRIDSAALPWYYLPRYISLTTPLVFLAGLGFFPVLFVLARRHFNARYLLVLAFMGFFPVWYAIRQHSGFYNGWRHMTFVYAPLVVLAALSFEYLLRRLRRPWAQALVAGVFVLGLALPLRSMLRNHPFQYMYYNELIGGMKGAFGRYEADYFGVSTRQAADWIKAHADLSKPTVVACNYAYALGIYFEDTPNVKVVYVRYHERSETAWDYGVFLTGLISPQQFLNKTVFPASNTIQAIRVDDAPIAVILKRKSKEDFEGVKLYKQGRLPEALTKLEAAARREPENEDIQQYLANAYNNLGQYPKALAYAQRSLQIAPDYGAGLMILGVAYINLGQNDAAILAFDEILRLQPDNADAHRFLTMCYDRKVKTDGGSTLQRTATQATAALHRRAYQQITGKPLL